MSKLPTYEELINDRPAFIDEYDGSLYIRRTPKPSELAPDGIWYSNEMWKVNKKTKEVSHFNYIVYMAEIMDKATRLTSPK